MKEVDIFVQVDLENLKFSSKVYKARYNPDEEAYHLNDDNGNPIMIPEVYAIEVSETSSRMLEKADVRLGLKIFKANDLEESLFEIVDFADRGVIISNEKYRFTLKLVDFKEWRFRSIDQVLS